LPAGDYLAVAVRRVPKWPDPAWLESLRSVAVPVRLDDGETRAVRLRLPDATVLPRGLSNMLAGPGQHSGRLQPSNLKGS
jgi:hypothetical protein